jgi:hypothetical protein
MYIVPMHNLRFHKLLVAWQSEYGTCGIEEQRRTSIAKERFDDDSTLDPFKSRMEHSDLQAWTDWQLLQDESSLFELLHPCSYL